MPSGSKVRWFRAPCGKYSSAMRTAVLDSSMQHVLGDSYCGDFAVDDAPWIAATMLRQVDSGSILILHMPERNFREHTLEALRLVLEGLQCRGLHSVTLSELAAMAEDDAADAAAAGRKSARSCCG
eukprot:NODE_7073_length_463_cov_302.740196.p1 GENE.NODE_7073_length_463_cov_302.740196~~NODE_7073_length_463_cov_302.740196.p1  ORF type:complete len:133 (-),score=40.53 NODE_7073_length_463_cov_302.740196:48-425(-)